MTSKSWRSFYVHIDSSIGISVTAEIGANTGTEAIEIAQKYQDHNQYDPRILSWIQQVTKGIGGS